MDSKFSDLGESAHGIFEQYRADFELRNNQLTAEQRLDIWLSAIYSIMSDASPFDERNQYYHQVITLPLLGEQRPAYKLETFLKIVALSSQQSTRDDALSLVGFMHDLGLPQSWCSNPQLFAILIRFWRLDIFEGMLHAGITDLWLPLANRSIRKWITEDDDVTSFMKSQELCLDLNSQIILSGQHFRFVDFDQMGFEEVDSLGSGGVGEVYRVRSGRDEPDLACKIMSRPGMHKKHRDLMLNFERELSGMRRAQHQHCVALVASCTSMKSVTILSSPVADMDLAQFLDLDLDALQMDMLSKAVGCITSALAYLHHLGIRQVAQTGRVSLVTNDL